MATGIRLANPLLVGLGRVAQYDATSMAINALFDVHLVGADLVDGATAGWSPRAGQPSWVLGTGVGVTGDEPAVSSGILTFAGGTEVVEGPTGLQPALDTGDRLTLMFEAAPSLTGDVTQVLFGMSSDVGTTLAGLSVLVVTSVPTVRARLGDGVATAINANATPVADETMLFFVRVGARGADGLIVDRYRVGNPPVQQSASTAALADCTGGIDMSLGRISGGTGNNYEGTMKRFGYATSLLADGDLDTVAGLLGYDIA